MLYVFTKNNHDQSDRISPKNVINMTIIISYKTSPHSGLFETMVWQQNTITK